MNRSQNRAQRWQQPPGTESPPLDRFVREKLGNVSWNQVRKLITAGKLTINGTSATIPTMLVNAGDDVEFVPTRSISEPRNRFYCTLVHVDSQIIVVDKPAGISTVPFDQMERDTLLHRLRACMSLRCRDLRPQIHVVHRIDKETRGPVVFARTQVALRFLKHLFRIHAIERRYLALVHGQVTDRTIRSRLVTNRGDGRRGSTTHTQLGREAITHVRVLEQLQSATLVECRLETGRTHQIRIHLSESGHPLLGEKVYKIATARQLPAAPRLMLHAQSLGFQYPHGGDIHRWTSEPPDDMAEMIRTLRVKRHL